MKLILVALFTFLFANCFADGPSISGNTSVAPGATESYTVNWEQWDNTYENYANVSWNVTGGTVISFDKHTITIQWNTLEGYLNGSGEIDVSEDLSGAAGSQIITIVNTAEGVSELCDGFLGPPIIEVNFGSGANPGPALPAGTTTYSYSTGCAISPGQYTLVNNSSTCRDLWWSILQDHTGNPNGYFLMVDGNSSRGEFYRHTITGLVPSIRYEFSVWCGNLINRAGYGRDPKIRFEIHDLSDNIIGTSGTIDVPYSNPFQWRQIGFMVNLPTGVTSVQAVIVDEQGASGGNDIVLDDISFAPCYPSIVASFSGSGIVDRAHACNNGTVNLYSSWPSVVPFQNPSYKWQRSTDNGVTWNDMPGATSINYIQTESVPGVYQYRIYSFETAQPSEFVFSNILTYYVQILTVDATTTDFYACNGYAAGQLPAFYHLLYSDPSDVENFTFLWSPATYLNNPNVVPTYFSLPVTAVPDNGPAQPIVNYTYTLTVTNTNYGCTASNTETVAVHNARKVFVPSAFTPNGDGNNDLFRPINIEDYPGSKFWVYNRWGNLVFYSEGPTLLNYSWDGTYNGNPQDPDTFVWQVSLIGCPTRINSASDGDGVSHGTVVLIR